MRCQIGRITLDCTQTHFLAHIQDAVLRNQRGVSGDHPQTSEGHFGLEVGDGLSHRCDSSKSRSVFVLVPPTREERGSRSVPLTQQPHPEYFDEMLATYELGMQWIPDDQLLSAAKEALPPITGSWKGLLGSGSVGPAGFLACQRGGWREVETSFGENSGYIAFVEGDNGGQETYMTAAATVSPPQSAQSLMTMTEGYTDRAASAASATSSVEARALDFFEASGRRSDVEGITRSSRRAEATASATSPTDRHNHLRSAVESSNTAAILAAHGTLCHASSGEVWSRVFATYPIVFLRFSAAAQEAADRDSKAALEAYASVVDTEDLLGIRRTMMGKSWDRPATTVGLARDRDFEDRYVLSK